MAAFCDFPCDIDVKVVGAPSRNNYRGPDARELIKEIERQLDILGNPAVCPVRASETPQNGMDVWVSSTPYLHLNVCLPVS